MPLAGGAVALGVWAPGDSLTGDHDAEQTLMGHTLARAHLVTRTGRAAGRLASWLDVERDSLGIEAWLRPAYEMVMAEYAALPPLTWATLHSDPAPEAFRSRDVIPADEWVHLDALRRGRWLVQAAYFAERLATDDLTGTDLAGNREGFDRARRGLRELGVG